MSAHVVTRVREGKARCTCGATFKSKHAATLYRRVLAHYTTTDLAAVALAAERIPNHRGLEYTQREGSA